MVGFRTQHDNVQCARVQILIQTYFMEIIHWKCMYIYIRVVILLLCKIAVNEKSFHSKIFIFSEDVD